MARVSPLTDEEKTYIVQACDDNLLMSTDELVECICEKFNRNPETIRAYMWKEGFRPRQEVRRDHYIGRIAKEVARDTGFSPEPYQPSPIYFKLLKKIWYQRLVEVLSNHKEKLHRN